MIRTSRLLMEQPFFAGMRQVHLERLSYHAERATFTAGTRIFNEGGHAERFWVIRQGRVDLQTHVPGHGDVVVERLGPNAVLGWSWMFPAHLWHFGAVAVEPTLAIELDGPRVLQLCEGEPEFGFALTRRLVGMVIDRLQTTRARLIEVHAEPAAVRSTAEVVTYGEPSDVRRRPPATAESHGVRIRPEMEPT